MTQELDNNSDSGSQVNPLDAPMPEAATTTNGQSVAEVYSDFFQSALPGSKLIAPTPQKPSSEHTDSGVQTIDEAPSQPNQETISDGQLVPVIPKHSQQPEPQPPTPTDSAASDFFSAKLPGSQSISRPAKPVESSADNSNPGVDPAATLDEPRASSNVESKVESNLESKVASNVDSVDQQTIDEPATPSRPTSVAASGEFVAQAGASLGEFALEKKLGQGGMGEVWLANQVSLDRPVAVKLLPRGFASQPQFVDRFEREAKSAASLVHPNVIQIYAFGIQDGAPYFAMEYVEGEDLQQRLERQGQLPLTEIIDIMIGVASALAAAGDKDIVHRDIKPSNVMLDTTGNVKVMDFGLAKATSMAGASLTQSGLIMGTPKYMSPEQARGDEVDKRSDLYSLGVAFYELLTGQLPFRSDTPAGLIFKHVYEAPPLPRGKNEDIPPFLEDVVMRLLEKDPDARYDSAHDLLTELREYQSNQAYYLNGGERREPAERAVSGKTRARSVDGSGERSETIIVEKRSSGLMTFVILVLLLGIGAAVAYMGHEQKYWQIPYLPVKKKIVTPPPKKPDDDPKPKPPVDKRVNVTFDLSLRDVTMYWDVRDPNFTPVGFASTDKVLPGQYQLKLLKKGRRELIVGITVGDKGQLTISATKTKLSDFIPDFQPTAELENHYNDALKAIEEKRYSDALKSLQSAQIVDPQFRPNDSSLTVLELLADTRRKNEQASEQERQWSQSLERANQYVAEKNWRLAQIQLREISTGFKRYDEVKELKQKIEEKLKKIDASKQKANELLTQGAIDATIEVLKAISNDVAKDQQIEAILAQANAAREYKKKADEQYKTAQKSIAAQDYKAAQAPLTEALAAYKKYLKIAPNDKAAKTVMSSVTKKLNESSSLQDLVAQLRDALAKQQDIQIVELSNAILSRNSSHELAQKSRTDAQLRIDTAAITETLKTLDSALVSSDPMAALKVLKEKSGESARIREFLTVARFTSSAHSIESVKRTGAVLQAKVRWSFTVEFIDVTESVTRERIQQFDFVLVQDSSTWIIAEIQ